MDARSDAGHGDHGAGDHPEGLLFCSLVLPAVPKEPYEAAGLDAAGSLTQFVHVTLPGIQCSIGLLAALAFTSGAIQG